MIKKTKYILDINSVLNLIKNVPIKWNSQLSVKSRSGNDLLDGIGSINEYKGASEKDFDKINSFFKNSDVERLLSSLEDDGYKHGRVRIMRMSPKTVYSYHMDCEPRLHFALQTNENSMLIIDDKVYRIPADGKGYWADTTKLHTAVNASLDAFRIHLVIDLLVPVKKEGNNYILLNKKMSQEEFNVWLREVKPPTEPIRQDFYFV
jgi:hypothetical protein